MAANINNQDVTKFKFIKVISYNMHGFNQGYCTVRDLICSDHPDIILCQEHWLTPSNLYKFNDNFSEYFSFGCSAMSNKIEAGILTGRPFGGVMTLVKNNLKTLVETIYTEDRFAVVKVANCLFFNIYLPCVGTKDRLLICQTLFDEMLSIRERYPNCECVIAGDFNVDLNTNDEVAQLINSFIEASSLARCDILFSCADQNTYINVALNQCSHIDYFLVSSTSNVVNFNILDPDVNYSDHLPITMTFACMTTVISGSETEKRKCIQPVYRWDKADVNSYYYYTGCHLEPILSRTDNCLSLACAGELNNFPVVIDSLYCDIVSVLSSGARLYVPVHRKGYYKYWWDQELTAMKESAVESNKLWKIAGKPRQGPIFEKRQKYRAQYRKGLRDAQKLSTSAYTNELHEALLAKNGQAFWRCWRSKFEIQNKCVHVGGCSDDEAIAKNFAEYFSNIYVPNDSQRASSLFDEYSIERKDYFGYPLTPEKDIDTELVSKVVQNLKCGRAPDIDNLMAEHLQRAHPIISVILSKLFHLIVLCKHIPTGFGLNYIVPIPKAKDIMSKALNLDDFRGIAISPIISKIFEYCLIEKFNEFLITDEKQFGFKKGIGCSHAIYTIRTIVDQFTKNGTTVNLCSVDLSKAFDKVNHYGLFIKLMKRKLPVELLELLENWLSKSLSCVKWNSAYSEIFSVKFGVRQGSVLSPYLFAIYVDDISSDRCLLPSSFVILYADDILLIAPSVSELQRLFNSCELELLWLDMRINVKKSCCLRIGPRCDTKCVFISTSSGYKLPWVNEIRYLGTYIIQSRYFKCSLSQAKKSYYRALNAIFGKVGRAASEEVTLELVKLKCLPILLYGLECYSLNKSELKSLDFPVMRFLMKMFRSSNVELINDCRVYFDVKLPSELWAIRKVRFLEKFKNCQNLLHYFGLCKYI